MAKKARLKRRANNTGNIYKASGNRTNPYIARVANGYKEDGKRDWLPVGSFTEKADAEKALSLYEITPVAKNPNITFEELFYEWYDVYFSENEELSDKTKTQYKTAFKHLKPIHKHKFTDLRAPDYIKIIKTLKIGKSGKNKIKILLNLMYEYAKSEDIVLINYSKIIKIGKPKKTKQPTFSIDQIKFLLEHDDIPYVDSVLILIFSGYRPTEMTDLEKDKINLNLKFMISGIKTEEGIDRITPIHPYIYKYIKKRCENTDKYLFVKEDGQKMSLDYYRKYIFKPLMRELGMDARQTFGTLAGKFKMETLAIQQTMGHTSYAFTADNYTNKDVEFLNEEIAKIVI